MVTYSFVFSFICGLSMLYYIRDTLSIYFSLGAHFDLFKENKFYIFNNDFLVIK